MVTARQARSKEESMPPPTMSRRAMLRPAIIALLAIAMAAISLFPGRAMANRASDAAAPPVEVVAAAPQTLRFYLHHTPIAGTIDGGYIMDTTSGPDQDLALQL